ncbi:TolC family protein, partial [Zoogloea sp.]|uniref:TolC family protein n=1 Tax=Zoogloea sp. TaxID=49181 RepID=UPI0014157DDA
MRIPFLLISSLWLGGAHAAPLTLAEADARLLEANPSIVMARSSVAAARAGIQIAGARPNPTLTLSASGSSPNRPGSTNHWDRATDNTIRIDQQIERGNKRELRLRAADDNLAATGSDLDNAIRLARSDLANAWAARRSTQA